MKTDWTSSPKKSSIGIALIFNHIHIRAHLHKTYPQCINTHTLPRPHKHTRGATSTTVFNSIQQCSTVFNSIQQCSTVFNSAQQCSTCPAVHSSVHGVPTVHIPISFRTTCIRARWVSSQRWADTNSPISVFSRLEQWVWMQVWEGMWEHNQCELMCLPVLQEYRHHHLHSQKDDIQEVYRWCVHGVSSEDSVVTVILSVIGKINKLYCNCLIYMDWIELNWIELNWIELNWIGLDWIGLD